MLILNMMGKELLYMIVKSFKRTKFACYSAYFTMSSIFTLPPLLFVTFHDLYGVSYTLLGTLVLTNFCTQLTIDLIFTLFSSHFNVSKVIRIMPLITSLGLLIYAFSPIIFHNQVFIGLLIGTVIFSVSAGLSEVLLSPVVAAIPSENPQRDMSMLHSLYAFGVFTVVILSTVFFKIFGKENWMYITLFFAVLPIITAVLFMVSPIPNMKKTETLQKNKRKQRNSVGLAFCGACIFFGSCAENVMSNWISGYMENALHIDKAFGDILGMAMFAILLGVARIGYAKYGKSISLTLIVGMFGAAFCYIIAGLIPNIFIALIACTLTGLFTSMLWPGSLILMEEKLPGIGLAAYALMASCGDLGASLAPQLMGIVVDRVAALDFAAQLGDKFGMTPEQIGMKSGMLISAIFPIIGGITVVFVTRYLKRIEKVNKK